MPKISLTNGAAQWGYGMLNDTKCKLADLWASGSLALKLQPASISPDRDKSITPEEFVKNVDAQRVYKLMVDEWLTKPFCEDGLEVSQTEFEYMRQLLKKKGEKEDLPGGFHVADLCRAFELDKP